MSNEIQKVIDITEERFKLVAPKSINYEAEKGFAMQILTNNSYLMKVALENNASLAQAITNVAAIGLSLNPAEKQAYLLSRTVNEDGKFVSKIFLEPSYIGLCKIATDSGSIEWVQADCVYANDSFMDKGVGEKPDHSYNAFGKERGDFVGVYCVAKTRTGDYLTTLMDSDEINSVMSRSEAVKAMRERNKGKGGPWVSDFKEMAKKTVIRNGFKTWPRTNERAFQAVHISNENEGFEPILSSPEINDFTGEQKSYYDQLITNNDSIGMYVLLTTVEETVRNNLYHSFEKGTKGKYQRIVDDLYRKGAAQIMDCVTVIEENLGGDDSAVLEIIEGFDNDTLKIIEDRLNPEMVMEFNKVKG